MDVHEVLQELGLKKNDIKVYISLLKHSNSSIQEIAAASSVHRVNVYDAIRHLKRQGLLTEAEHDGKRLFRASDPGQLKHLLHRKEEHLQAILPQLSSLHEQAENQTQSFQGLEGIKRILKEMLRVGEPISAFGIPKEMPERLSSFLLSFHRERIRKSIPIKHIYNENARERIIYLNDLEKCEARYLPSKYSVPATTVTFGNYTTFWIWSEEPFCVLIHSAKMAEAYKKYFKLLWSIAK